MSRSHPPVRVRVATAADEAALASLDAVAWTPRSGFPSVMEQERSAFFSEGAPPQAHLVAEVNGRLVGYVRLTQATPLPENAHVLSINGLAVAPDARRTGVGTVLLRSAESFARAHGARKLSLHVLSTNETALRLYRRLGYQVEGVLREEFRIDGRYVDDEIMCKFLA